MQPGALGAIEGIGCLYGLTHDPEPGDREGRDMGMLVNAWLAAASRGFVNSLQGNARGTIVAQVFPSERSLSTPMVKEASDLAAARGGSALSPAMLEGFAAAKVMVAALQAAGANPTRQRITAALNAMNKLNLGGLELGFSPSDHTGLDFVDLSIVAEDGRFLR
jgi:ABC-type branched-subunit amino acid transport system substrate-binding protein